LVVVHRFGDALRAYLDHGGAAREALVLRGDGAVGRGAHVRALAVDVREHGVRELREGATLVEPFEVLARRGSREEGDGARERRKGGSRSGAARSGSVTGVSVHRRDALVYSRRTTGASLPVTAGRVPDGKGSGSVVYRDGRMRPAKLVACLVLSVLPGCQRV